MTPLAVRLQVLLMTHTSIPANLLGRIEDASQVVLGDYTVIVNSGIVGKTILYQEAATEKVRAILNEGGAEYVWARSWWQQAR